MFLQFLGKDILPPCVGSFDKKESSEQKGFFFWTAAAAADHRY